LKHTNIYRAPHSTSMHSATLLHEVRLYVRPSVRHTLILSQN